MGACASKDGQVISNGRPVIAPNKSADEELLGGTSRRQEDSPAIDASTPSVISSPIAPKVVLATPSVKETDNATDHSHACSNALEEVQPECNISLSTEPDQGEKEAFRAGALAATSDSQEIWFDDCDNQSLAKNGETTPSAPAIDAAQRRRRRLSVSTVDGAKEAAATVIESEPWDAAGQTKRRSKLIKFNDPAMELVDRSKGSVREVTLGMLKSLFPEAEHYAVFGSPSYDIQRGFDNKAAETGGLMPPGKTLRDIGVAYACKKGLKPESPNQDDFFILRVDDWSMYGVFDGHGPCGHDISAFVHKTLPFLIISDPSFESDLPATLRRAFWRVHHLIEAAAEQAGALLDCSLSGTTATVAVLRDGSLTVAHVGDSRAVIAKKGSKENKFAAVALTIDHKPTNPGERVRIENAGGEVRRLEGDVPHRVFVKNRMYPGLAMSRAIGDAVGTAVGVTPDPDVQIYTLTPEDRFFVIATDGVWEFINCQQAVDIIAQKKAAQVNEAAESLAYESWRRWVEEEENVVDDVTCVVVWLDKSSSHRNRRRSRPMMGGHERRRR